MIDPLRATSDVTFELFQGIWSRVYEAAILLVLVGILIIGLAWVASAIFDGNKHTQETLLGDHTILYHKILFLFSNFSDMINALPDCICNSYLFINTSTVWSLVGLGIIK